MITVHEVSVRLDGIIASLQDKFSLQCQSKDAVSDGLRGLEQTMMELHRMKKSVHDAYTAHKLRTEEAGSWPIIVNRIEGLQNIIVTRYLNLKHLPSNQL